ncbi:SAP domain-containing protein [Ditylenchus destructor]|nr:SAP domain-containing protein [Ditylenchus destructor]
MISKEELEKFTVPMLKDKLKAHKLPLSGTKVDLVNRLYEYMVAEEKLLGSAGPSEFDLDNVDVDELLDNDNPVADQQSKKADDNTTKISEMEKLNAPTQNSAQTKVLDVSVPKKSTTGESKLTKVEDALPSGTAATATPTAKTEDSTTTTTVTTAEAGDDQVKKPSEEEKQQQLTRAKRLGLPFKEPQGTTVAPPNSVNVLQKRMQRFGPANEFGRSDDKDGKKQARMQRFGITAASTSPTATAVKAIASDETLQKRAKRFGLPIAEEEVAKKQSRLERFGEVERPSAGNKSTSGVKTSENTADPEVLRKRAQRFGLVTSS